MSSVPGLGLVRALASVPLELATRGVDTLVERAVDHALRGPLVEAVSRDIVRYAVLERAAQPLLDAGFADQVATRILEGPELERIFARALESPAAERLTVHLLESEDLWLLVDEVARSPAVTEAISSQSMSFADQVASGVRGRTRSADDRVERVARRLLRRRGSSVPETS